MLFGDFPPKETRFSGIRAEAGTQTLKSYDSLIPPPHLPPQIREAGISNKKLPYPYQTLLHYLTLKESMRHLGVVWLLDQVRNGALEVGSVGTLTFPHSLDFQTFQDPPEAPPEGFQEVSRRPPRVSRKIPGKLQLFPATAGSKQIPKLSRGFQRSPGVMGKGPLGDLLRGIGLSDAGQSKNPNCG